MDTKLKRKGLLISPFFISYLEMTSEPNTYTVNFQLSSGDGGLLNTADFNNLENHKEFMKREFKRNFFN